MTYTADGAAEQTRSAREQLAPATTTTSPTPSPPSPRRAAAHRSQSGHVLLDVAAGRGAVAGQRPKSVTVQSREMDGHALDLAQPTSRTVTADPSHLRLVTRDRKV